MSPFPYTNPPAPPGTDKEIDMPIDLNQDPLAADEDRMQAAQKREDARWVRSMDPEDCTGEAMELEREAAVLEQKVGVPS